LKATTPPSSPIPRRKSRQPAKEVGPNGPRANAKAYSLTRRKRDRYSPSRAVMQWWACHDLGDAEIMGIKVQIFGSIPAAA
jgi:hypothetical protein